MSVTVDRYVERAPRDPRETPDRASSTAEYARRFHGYVGQYFLQRQWACVERATDGRSELCVLDVGGGHAQLAPRLEQAGHRVTVIGSDSDCFRLLRQGARPLVGHCVAGDLLRLPFADRAFDMVVAFRMLAHLRAWQDFLAELCRVARWRVVVDYPDLRSVNLLAPLGYSWKKRIEGNTRPYGCFRQSEVVSALAAQGFQTRWIDRQFLFPMALHRRIGRRRFTCILEGAARTIGLTSLWGSPAVVVAQHSRTREIRS